MSPETQQQAPREGHVSVAGIPWMARMIDKARLDAAGTIDEYDLEYPCPMDRRLLNQLNIDGNTFQQIATQAQTDEQIIEALRAKGAVLD